MTPTQYTEMMKKNPLYRQMMAINAEVEDADERDEEELAEECGETDEETQAAALVGERV